MTLVNHPLNSPELLDILAQAPLHSRESIELALLSYWHTLAGDVAEQTAHILARAQELVNETLTRDLQARWGIANPVSYDAMPHGVDHFGSVTHDGSFYNSYQARPTSVSDDEQDEQEEPQPRWIGRIRAKKLLIGNKRERMRTTKLLCVWHGVQPVTSNGGGFRLECGCKRGKNVP